MDVIDARPFESQPEPQLDPALDRAAAEIDSQIAYLRGSGVFEKYHPGDAQYERAVEQMTALYAKRYPDEPADPNVLSPSNSLEVSKVAEEAFATEDQAEAAVLAELRQEWGASYEQNLNAAKAHVQALDRKLGGDVIPFLDATGLGSDKLVIQMFADAAAGRPGQSLTKDQARAIVDKINASDYYQRGHGPAQEWLVQIVSALYEDMLKD